MATQELNTASTEGDQKEEILSPSNEHSPPVVNEPSATLNFSELTPLQFGISVQSFTPASLPNHKDKSRLAQIKARRRSSIGVRGSPETNSLIRFMAQQRMKTPPPPKTLELIRTNPLFPRVASTLREKMAAFQSLIDEEESEDCDPVPRQDGNTGGCIKTRDYLSDGNNHYGGKENHPPMITPVPSKRRRLGPPESCEVEIREARTLIHPSLKQQQEEEEPATQVVTQGPLPSRETVEDAQAVLISPTRHIDFELQACSPAKNQQDGVFDHQSLGRPPPDDPAEASPARPASLFDIPSLPSLLEMKPTGEDESSGTSTVKKKKRRVHFGAPLSPEFFDKNLPPSTPLKKGDTPARAHTPGGSSQLRSVLKTPQRSEAQTPQALLGLCSPTEFGASPTLLMPRNRRMQSFGEDGEEKDGKIVFPSVEEIDSAVTSDTERTWAQPLNLDITFYEESLSQILTESETKPSRTSLTDAPLDELTFVPEKQSQYDAGVEAPAPAQSTNRRKKQTGPEQACSSEAPARSSSRKRKQPEESEPVRRSSRSAAKSASGKMKNTTQRWKKDVDRSLYGSRTFASKEPPLSPITERLSLIGRSPAAPQTPSTSCTAETHLNPEMPNDTAATGDLTVTDALAKPSEDSATSPNSSKESSTGRGRRLSGLGVRRRGLKKRKVSVADDILLREETLEQAGGETEEHREDQTTTNLEASGETPLNHSVPEQGEVHTDPHTSADTQRTDLDGKLECHGSLDAPTSDCPPPAEEPSTTLPAEPAQRKAKPGRRSSAHSFVLQEQGNQAGEHQTNHEVEEKGQREQAAGQQERNTSSTSSDSQEEGEAARLELAPWQADFNMEDVFKPVATRGQRSVRRSLRNQRNAEHGSNSAGLAWLPHTSPDSIKETCRKTRARRLSTAPPVQPAVPEETQEDAS